MLDIICCKCNHVLDINTEPDTGECPKCGGTMYQEGDIFDETSNPFYKALDISGFRNTIRYKNTLN